jgi:SAM-dependent methyltransferase
MPRERPEHWSHGAKSRYLNVGEEPGKRDRILPVSSMSANEDIEFLGSCNLCESTDLADIYPSTWVRVCRACGYTFRSPRPTSQAIERFYSRDGKYSHWLAELEGRKPRFRYRLEQLRKLVPRGRLLDVGAGIGEFLHQAAEFFETEGIEVSDEAIRQACKLFGIELKKGSLAEARGLLTGDFDVVSLIHVLEHVPDPAATITHCGELLRPGGWLFLAVPNDSAAGWFKHHWGTPKVLQRLARRGEPVSYAETPPFGPVDLTTAEADAEIHLSHFSAEGLARFLEKQGFEVMYVGPDPCYTQTGFRLVRPMLDFEFWRLGQSLFETFNYEAVMIISRRRG